MHNLINLLKKLFRKKKKLESKSLEFDDLQKWIQLFESLDEKKINDGLTTFSEIKNFKSRESQLFCEFIVSLFNYTKMNKAQKIVNEFGKAIVEASEFNKRKFEEFLNRIKTTSNKASLQEIKDDAAIYLLNKFDIRLLPYDKNTIKESIELLLKDETDVNKIEQLRVGLILLNDFIDFSNLD
jgi:hypothetical protein